MARSGKKRETGNLNIGNIEGIQHKFVNAEEIERSGGMIYDPGSGEPNLVDVDFMLNLVAQALEIMCQDDMIKLKKENNAQFEEEMEQKCPEFALRYYAVFKKVISGDDISPLFQMLTEIEMIHKGDKSLEQVEKELGEQYAAKYIYPKVGGPPNKKNKK
jgi:hypothetical protein